MQRVTVESSNLRSIGWCDNVLEIEFNHGGVYQYAGVDQLLFTEFLASNSKGQFFHQRIKNAFAFEKAA